MFIVSVVDTVSRTLPPQPCWFDLVCQTQPTYLTLVLAILCKESIFKNLKRCWGLDLAYGAAKAQLALQLRCRLPSRRAVMSRAGRHRCDGARWRCDVAAMARAAMSRAAMSRCDVAMMRRVYYTPERRFEQSYDVYYPANPDGSLPLVLLVPSSALYASEARSCIIISSACCSSARNASEAVTLGSLVGE